MSDEPDSKPVSQGERIVFLPDPRHLPTYEDHVSDWIHGAIVGSILTAALTLLFHAVFS